MSLKAAFDDLQDTLAAAPEALAVIAVPALPPMTENFHLPATVDAKQLKAATESGLPIVLASHIDPKDKDARACDLQPFAVRAQVFFRGPVMNGKSACVFETGERIHVKYSDASNGNVVATARPKDWWSI
jgi:hypothetical protein